MTPTPRRLFLITGAAMLVSIPTAAATQTVVAPVEVVSGSSIRISYADLDTRSTAGMETLARRVNWAVTTVCRYERGQVNRMSEEFACRYATRRDAWDQYARNESSSHARVSPSIELVMTPRRDN